MSGSASDPKDPAEQRPFVESEDQPTYFTYDKGGVPILIGLLWVGYIVTYIVVMSLLALPDLRAWMAQH